MEAKICCAYNLSRGCKISSKVTVADCASTPFKLMKLMLDCLAKDAETGFWLTHLSQTPQIVRIFPLDFVYLDHDLKIIQSCELAPEAKLPRFPPLATSALILPLNSLSTSSTVEGDTLILCAEAELEARIAEHSPAPDVKQAEPVPVPVDDGPIDSRTSKTSGFEIPPILVPGVSQQVALPMPVAAGAQGTGHTFALSSSWQISTSTSAGVLLESVAADLMEAGEKSVASAENSPVEFSDVSVTEAERTEFAEEPDATASAERVAVVEEEPKPQEVAPASPAVIETKDESAKAQAQAQVMDENPAILDTDLAAIFDAAIAEEFGSDGLEGPGASKQKARGTASPKKEAASAVITEPKAAAEDPETAKKDPNLYTAPQVTEGAKPTTATRERAQAPATIAQANAVAKSQREKLPDKVSVTTPEAQSQSERTKSTSRERKKSLGYLVKEFLNCPDPLPELRTAPRLVQQGMVAYEKSADSSSPMEVRDVSPAGLYLRTKKRWQPRKVFSLTLQRKGATEDDFQSRVRMKVAAMRSDPGGVGLCWVFPKNVKFDPWRRVHTKRSDETDIQFFIREIRLAKALGFLQEVCPVAKEEIDHALHERFSNKRVASAVEIVLKAEDLLSRSAGAAAVLAHSEVVMRVLENGSWIEDDWIRKMWAGLLVSSCSPGGNDKSNLQFLELMARLTPIHLRIFSFVCKRAVEAIAEGQPETKLQIHSTAKELMEAADSHSFQRIQQTVGHLSNFGLLQEVMRPSYAAGDDKSRMRTTPSPMGLKMYANCLGQRA